MNRFSPLQLLLLLSFLLASTVIVQFLLPHQGNSAPALYKSEANIHSINPSIMRLKLDIKEYLMVQDDKYLRDFDTEAAKLAETLTKLGKESLVAKSSAMQKGIGALSSDLKTYEQSFKRIVALEKENAGIEGNVFAKYNTLLEEHPNKILFQSFMDNDPMSGNSAAYLLDALLKYKISAASFTLNNNDFFLIRIKELKDEIEKHANKIEVVVDNKESLKRIKIFKEAFALYAQGFEQIARNSQAKKAILTTTFEELLPRMNENAETLRSMVEKAQTSEGMSELVDTSWVSKFSLLIFCIVSFCAGMITLLFFKRKGV
ncbi:hypothetical protein [Sulfurospirillum multivorans]|uniref:Methyl-accepting chemotaxis protein n=2 Tax=Sulfurospirillum multivorans TaxID=66821 RepID=A0AA86ANL7_SULMK|nr:hypothetical protein [Sulfurospirillum multivorans]AHJ13824.1 hypothetical protein SMUL_2583 [Sulfurospirillum multivorans DSM 12446]QEH07314.1 hypothetical protein SMN_2558 [Sulfurospirillum multivorans]